MIGNQIVLFVGDIDDSLSTIAKNYDPSAYLIDQFNYKEFLTKEITVDTTVYTSLGDLPKDPEIFYRIGLTATEIVYAPPEKWSDGLTVKAFDPTSSIKGSTELLLLQLANIRPVKNIELCYFTPRVNPVIDQRKTDNPQLWVAGCSITSGLGVADKERYGQLIADKLGVACSFLAEPASSISWAADQILRADIQPGDTVIWGITCTTRVSFIKHKKLKHVTSNTYEDFPELDKELPLSTLFNEDTFYSHLYSIEQVINYCRRQNIKLVLLGLLTSPNILRYLKTKDNYLDFPHKLKFSNNSTSINYIDLGTDQKHPGPQQHQLYADYCQSALSNN